MAKADSTRSRTPLLEWIAAGIGLLLLLAMLGVIAREAVTGETEKPPAITLRARTIAPAPGGFFVEVEVSNASGATAAALQVEGMLMDRGAEVERSSFDFDYVPGHSSRKGGLFFTQDPRRLQLELRALGYQEP